MSRMELSPQAVAAATFKTVKRGYDPDEVRAYLVEVSASLEASHQQATAMEARARAAIAKLQDATHHPPSAGPVVASDEAETISRTLLLAQRTADTTVAQAEADAAAIVAKAQAEAATMVAAAETEVGTISASARAEAAELVERARAESAEMVERAKAEAHRMKDEEHLRIEAEVHDLHHRREALLSDVTALEQHADLHRTRLLEASAALLDLAESETGGLAPLARPELAAPAADLPAPDAPAAAPAALEPPDVDQLITGQVPVIPGVEPLVSPRPSSAAEVRSMWQEAERADGVVHDDTLPMVVAGPNGSNGSSGALADPTPAESVAAIVDDVTPVEGMQIGGDELR